MNLRGRPASCKYGVHSMHFSWTSTWQNIWSVPLNTHLLEGGPTWGGSGNVGGGALAGGNRPLLLETCCPWSSGVSPYFLAIILEGVFLCQGLPLCWNNTPEMVSKRTLSSSSCLRRVSCDRAQSNCHVVTSARQRASPAPISFLVEVCTSLCTSPAYTLSVWPCLVLHS